MFDRLLGPKGDRIERVRRKYYPRLHPHLVNIGEKVGIPLYSTGSTEEDEFVGRTDVEEEPLEVVLHDHGFERNPAACFKTNTRSGLPSEGSWRLTHQRQPMIVEKGMQLHVTLYETDDTKGTRLYAHYERDYMSDPVGHLKAKDFSAKLGVEKTKALLGKSITLH